MITADYVGQVCRSDRCRLAVLACDPCVQPKQMEDVIDGSVDLAASWRDLPVADREMIEEDRAARSPPCRLLGGTEDSGECE